MHIRMQIHLSLLYFQIAIQWFSRSVGKRLGNCRLPHAVVAQRTQINLPVTRKARGVQDAFICRRS
jgi:hypothetical protein